MNNVGYFEIQATDPDRVVAFYERVFGWRFVEQPHCDGNVFGIFEVDESAA